jgi:hypothetical protein
MPENDDDDVNLPYKMAKMLVDKGILVGLENSGSMERMNTKSSIPCRYCAVWSADRGIAINHIKYSKTIEYRYHVRNLKKVKMLLYLCQKATPLDMRTNKLTQAFIQGKLLNLDNHQSKLNAIYKRNTINSHGNI